MAQVNVADIVGEVRKLTLEKGDIVIIRCKRILKLEEKAALEKAFDGVFKNNRVVVLPPELEIDVIAPR